MLPIGDIRTMSGYRFIGRAADDLAGAAELIAEVDGSATLTSIEVSPRRDGAQDLVGLTVRHGFRDALQHALRDEVENSTPLALILDDLPVAALISGYGLLYNNLIPTALPTDRLKSDICSGWRTEGTMMTSVRMGRGVPTTLGPVAPPTDDEFARLDPLPPHGMRRQRMIDTRHADSETHVYAWFRDTYADSAGVVTVLHEYDLTAHLVDGVFTSVDAVPRVLPYVECPVAAASADTLVGLHPADVREHARATLRGTRTCTHLNDLLRSLADIDA